MPRQTRARVASARQGEPSSSSLSLNQATTAAPAKTAPEAHVRSDSTDIYGVSDREVEYQRKTKQAVEAEQSAVNDADEPSTTTTRRSTRGRTAVLTTTNAMDKVALQSSKKRRDDAMSKLDNLTSTTNDAVDSSAANDDSPVAELGRKDHAVITEASSLLGPRTRGSLSGMEIMDDEIFGNLDSSFEVTGKDGTDNDGARSADTSAFSVSVFRRTNTTRRRRSSIIGKDDAPIRPTSRGPTTPGLSSAFSMGNFQRRRRQPSILMSSAQKASIGLQRPKNADETEDNDNAVASGGEEEESFLPEAEGTPVRQGRRSTIHNQETKGPPDTEDEVEVGLEAQPATRSRKRKSTDAHKSEAAKRQTVEAEQDDDEIHSSIELDERSSPPSFVERRHRTPELDSDILAPPESSSSQEGSPTMWPSLRDLGKKSHRQAPARARKAELELDDAMSDISEPPSLTHSPNFKATKPAAKKKRAPSPKLSTADLEALMPRRRRKVQRDDDDDGDEFGLSESEQERSRPKPRAAKKKTTTTTAQPLHSNSKANQTKHASAAPAKRTTRRKYGSRHFDKENTAEGDSIEVTGDASEPLDDTAFEADVTGDVSSSDLAEELKAASRKFKEVDKWELDFEEVVEPSSDLPEGR